MLTSECGAEEGERMPEGSRPSDLEELETEHVRISERITRLTEAISELENARTLRADAAARLVKYRENRERLEYERRKLEWEIQGPRGAPQADETVPTLADATLDRARREGKKNGRMRL